MSERYIFQDDDPKDMPFPVYHQIMFHQSTWTAQEILKDRSPEEIILTVKDIDIYLNENSRFHNPKLFINNPEYKVNKDELGSTTGREGFIFLVRLFKENDKTPFKHIKDATWSELFAIYTLGTIAYANRELEQMEDHADFNREDYLFEIAGNYVTEAVEASTVADFLYDKASPLSFVDKAAINQKAESIAKDKIKAQNKKAAQSRHQPTNQLKLEFIAFYQSSTFNSKRQAAREFYESLPENRQLFPTYDGALRALVDALTRK